MTAKDKIIAAIRAVKLESDPILDVKINGLTFVDKRKQFIEVLTSIGGVVSIIDSMQTLEEKIADFTTPDKIVINGLEPIDSNYSKDNLYEVDIAIVKGGIAVAENGAIWVTEKNMVDRMLPFSCEQLVIVIEEKNIVNNLHEAYDAINISEEGYGVFIAGPSKTADIEQSLVIGAHGPVALQVLIIKENSSTE
jgi:L-lactate dehydrogenase complex protein LldG